MINTNYLALLSGPWKLLVGVLIIWSIIWKGLALWKSAHQDQKYWFIAMLILNTLGILEILYIFVFSKKNLFSPKKKIKI